VERWKEDRLAAFSYHLQMLLTSGIALLDSIQLLTAQRVLPEKAGQKLVTSIQRGESFSSALRQLHFPAIFCSFIEAAEYHGDICFALEHCNRYYRSRARWSRKIKQTLFYPLFIFCFLTVGLLFLSIVVLPTFAELYQSFAFSLPVITQGVFAFAQLFPYVLVSGGLLCLCLHWSRRQAYVQQLLTKVPLVATYYRYRYTQYLALQFGSFLLAGVPMLKTVTLLEKVTPWPPLRTYLTTTKKLLIQGEMFGSIVQHANVALLPIFAQTVRLGEETGKLGEMLGQLAQTTEEWLTDKMEKWMTYLEPMLTLFIGIIMAIVVISLFLPMFGLIQVIQ
jgi:type II secretory pathway component PulF